MFCAPKLFFGGTDNVGSSVHVLFSRTYFRRYRGRRVPFSCFALPNSFSVGRRASGAVFMFCAPGLIFDGSEGVVSHFHVLCSQTNFQRYRGRQVPFSFFAQPDPLSALLKASGPFFMFYAPGPVFRDIEGAFLEIPRASGPVFGETKGVGSCFHVLR
jgi:hypothetical protein